MTELLEQIPVGWVVAVAAVFLLLFLLMRLPFVGGIIRFAVTLALLGALVLAVSERAAIDPYLAQFTGRLNLDEQTVEGGEVRIRMSRNGHFYANVTLGGAERRMLVDSGATVTAVSPATAEAAGVRLGASVVPVVIQTANGAVPAKSARVEELRIGNIVARNLRVVVSPAFGNLDVLGMNFLSRLKSWRVEGKTLILVPHHPQPAAGARSG